MFLLPLVLVLIITIVQDSAFKRVNENKVSLLIVNHDKGELGNQLTVLLKKSGLFDLETDNTIPAEQVKKELLNRNKLIAVLIPLDFSVKLNGKANKICNLIMEELQLKNNTSLNNNGDQPPSISVYYDPVLQENYSYSITNAIYSYLNVIENSLMIEDLYKTMGFNTPPEKLKKTMETNKVNIIRIPATINNDIIPNSTQHNVPAWTIFAMFFMVISLGSNIVKERINGSFIRLKTMPVHFSLVLFSKLIIYLAASIIQVIIIFSVGIFLFPYLHLPQLILPSNFVAFCLVVLLSAMAAVSYALMIGSLAKTQEQANGFGSVSIIIFAALGGILVPTFVMPDYLKFISNFSPLHWCLEGFYTLFLKGGDWILILKIMVPLLIFILFCQSVVLIKLKMERIL